MINVNIKISMTYATVLTVSKISGRFSCVNLNLNIDVKANNNKAFVVFLQTDSKLKSNFKTNIIRSVCVQNRAM